MANPFGLSSQTVPQKLVEQQQWQLSVQSLSQKKIACRGSTVSRYVSPVNAAELIAACQPDRLSTSQVCAGLCPGGACPWFDQG
jgi:hypothetical protein